MNQPTGFLQSTKHIFGLTKRGFIAIAWSLSPLALFLFSDNWGFGSKTIVVTTIANLVMLAFMYMQRISLWTRQQKQRVRGAAGLRLVNLAFLMAAVSSVTFFVLMLGGTEALNRLSPTLRRYTPPLMSLVAWGGFAFLLDLLAVVRHTERLVQAGIEPLPPYLDPKNDLVELAMPTVAENLNLEDKDPRIIEREQQKDGGVRFVITWQENVQRDIHDVASGTKKTVEFTEEQEYEITLDVQAKIVSLKAQK